MEKDSGGCSIDYYEVNFQLKSITKCELELK